MDKNKKKQTRRCGFDELTKDELISLLGEYKFYLYKIERKAHEIYSALLYGTYEDYEIQFEMDKFFYIIREANDVSKVKRMSKKRRTIWNEDHKRR